jgi:hypothetical protein
MANTIKRGESLFIPFKNGESIYDSQLKPRMYKTKEQYDRFNYHFKDAEMVEYTEAVRCKDCKHYHPRCQSAHWEGKKNMCCRSANVHTKPDDFCSYGERKDND